MNIINALFTEILFGNNGTEGINTTKWNGTLLADTSSVTGLTDLPSSAAVEYQFVLGGVLQEPTVDFTIDSESGTINIVGDTLEVDTDFFLIYRSVAIDGVGDVSELETEAKEIVPAINEQQEQIQNLSVALVKDYGDDSATQLVNFEEDITGYNRFAIYICGSGNGENKNLLPSMYTRLGIERNVSHIEDLDGDQSVISFEGNSKIRITNIGSFSAFVYRIEAYKL